MTRFALFFTFVTVAGCAAMLLVPLYFITVQSHRGHLRLQFGLGALIAFVTLAAVVLGIACSALPWPIKGGFIWTLLLCVFGWATRWRVPRT